MQILRKAAGTIALYSQNYLLNKLIFSLYITKGSDNTVQWLGFHNWLKQPDSMY